MTYLDVRFVQFKCLTSVCQGIPVALCLEVCKAAVAIVHCHGGIEINCLGVEVDSLVKLVICISEGDANMQLVKLVICISESFRTAGNKCYGKKTSCTAGAFITCFHHSITKKCFRNFQNLTQRNLFPGIFHQSNLAELISSNTEQ